MKRFPLLALGVAALAACTPSQPQTQVCNPVTDLGTVTGSFTPAGGTKVLDPDKVEVAPSQVVVTDSTFTASAGDLLVSNCNDGLLRKVSSVSTQMVRGDGVSSQAVRKVYIQTENASLEDAIASGDATLNWGTMQIGDDTMTQSLPGVSAQAITGRINLTNVSFSPISGVTVTLNGFIQQNLQPNFSLKFSSGSVETFRAGVNGSLQASITATVQASRSYSPFNLSRDLASWNIKRAFLVGSVPVVVVIQPKLVAAVSSNAAGQVKVEVGINPTFTTNVQLDYNRTRPVASRWQNTFTANFALNPTFKYDTPAGGNANASTGFVMDVKFYGLAGPSLEARPFINLALSGNSGSATLKSGINGSSKVEAGFKVLGKGLETSYAGPSIEEAKTFACQAPSTCTAN